MSASFVCTAENDRDWQNCSTSRDSDLSGHTRRTTAFSRTASCQFPSALEEYDPRRVSSRRSSDSSTDTPISPQPLRKRPRTMSCSAGSTMHSTNSRTFGSRAISAAARPGASRPSAHSATSRCLRAAPLPSRRSFASSMPSAERLVIDESDFRFSDERAEIVKILNNGNAKGFPVLRSEVTPGKDFNPKAFDVFGPKIIATRRSFDDRALESRCITEEMTGLPPRPDIPLSLPDTFHTEAEHLRNQLLSYRVRGARDRYFSPCKRPATRSTGRPGLRTAPGRSRGQGCTRAALRISPEGQRHPASRSRHYYRSRNFLILLQSYAGIPHRSVSRRSPTASVPALALTRTAP